MAFVTGNSPLVSFKMCRWIERKCMMRVIKLMGKYFAIKCPTECICQHADVQHKDGRIDKALIHIVLMIYPASGSANNFPHIC